MAFSPDEIERFRSIGLRLDRAGRFWHQGAEVTHPRVRQALLRWLDVRESDGRIIVRLDDTRYAYIDVEDAPLRVISARWDDDRVRLVLDDGGEEELAYATLRIGADDALYCRVRGGRLEARVTTSAYQALADGIDADPQRQGEAALSARGQRWPIRVGGV